MSGALRAGTARVTITPPVGLHLQGYQRGRPTEGIRDELYARALVLERGETRFAMICADIIGMEPDSGARTRGLVEQTTVIRGGAVCIAVSHTHSEPVVSDVVPIEPQAPDFT